MKFEEDVLPPFRSVFSRSNALWFGRLPRLREQSGWFNLGATTKTAYAYEGL
jgi:hypothetical protein